MHYKIAVIGFGSIGKRHIQNMEIVLAGRGCTFQLDLIRSGQGQGVRANLSGLVHSVYSTSDSIPKDYDIIFVTNPTSSHFETILKFSDHTRCFFIEKPVFHQYNVDIVQLENLGNVCYVACPLRYHKVIQYIKEQINLDEVYSIRAISSSYLPEWRVGADYRKSYSAIKELGGGVALDLIHEWDYLTYLFGEPLEVKNMQGKYSGLDINTEDIAIYIARFKNYLLELHLDYFGRAAQRQIEFYMKDDRIIGDIQNSCITFLKSGVKIDFKEERNQFQIRELEAFFDIIEGKRKNENDIKKALEVLKIAINS